MQQTICLPLTAATRKLHLGNLYSWLLADTYMRASNLAERPIVTYESWNCLSKKLEEDPQLKEVNEKERVERIEEMVEKNIEDARKIFRKYAFSFRLPAVRDDRADFREFLLENYARKREAGVIDSSEKLTLPDYAKIADVASKIHWVPSFAPKRMKGIHIEDRSYEIFRQGFCGISSETHPGRVFGQKFVQAHIPAFMQNQGLQIDAGFYGSDVLTKWLYFLFGIQQEPTFRMIGLTGIILNHNRKKLTKYDSNVPLISDIKEHPDTVRLSLLKQPFGRDFVYPTLSQEERVRLKALNCLRFLGNSGVRENSSNLDLSEIKDSSRRITEDILEARFDKAYALFRHMVYVLISKKCIEQIKSKGIKLQDLGEVRRTYQGICSLFIPVSYLELEEKKVNNF
ncbi:hypothetical protein HYZ97_02545 [Candidatus Pacearchaeota archaeon]|nr:hypothetical protein [Candidatus Pacearchaeota archaeon]